MKISTKTITVTGLLAAISSVIMFVEVNIPFMPAFLKMDFSDIPALLGAMIISPFVGIFVLAVKNLVHLSVSGTGGVGELANFIIGCCFLLPPSIIYRYKKRLGYILLGVLIGIIAMTSGAGIFNYYVLLPLYSKFMNMEAIIEMGSKVNPLINSKLTLVLYGIVPFNIIKGIVISIFVVVLLKYMPKTVTD